MKNFTYVNPSSVEEASELLKQPRHCSYGRRNGSSGCIKGRPASGVSGKGCKLKEASGNGSDQRRRRRSAYWGRGNSASDRRFCSSTGWLECPG